MAMGKKEMKRTKTGMVWAVTAFEKTKEGKKKGRSSHDAEPYPIKLNHYENDRTLRGYSRTVCCDCGLEHFETFEVFEAAKGHFWMMHRSYRDDLASNEINRKKKKYAFVPRKKSK